MAPPPAKPARRKQSAPRDRARARITAPDPLVSATPVKRRFLQTDETIYIDDKYTAFVVVRSTDGRAARERLRHVATAFAQVFARPDCLKTNPYRDLATFYYPFDRHVLTPSGRYVRVREDSDDTEPGPRPCPLDEAQKPGDETWPEAAFARHVFDLGGRRWARRTLVESYSTATARRLHDQLGLAKDSPYLVFVFAGPAAGRFYAETPSGRGQFRPSGDGPIANLGPRQRYAVVAKDLSGADRQQICKLVEGFRDMVLDGDTTVQAGPIERVVGAMRDFFQNFGRVGRDVVPVWKSSGEERAGCYGHTGPAARRHVDPDSRG